MQGSFKVGTHFLFKKYPKTKFLLFLKTMIKLTLKTDDSIIFNLESVEFLY